MMWGLNVIMYGISGVGCIAGLAVVLLVTFQEKLVYVPIIPGQDKGYPTTPNRFKLRYEDVWLRSVDGVRLHSWFIKYDSDTEGPTILFFQENAGNIAHRLDFVMILMRNIRCNVFMLSYRGYGASDGAPSQRGLTLDAQAALDHLRERTDIDPTRIIAFGRSLGGAVATQLVKDNPGKVAGLVLENTFTSILDMAGVMLPFLRVFISGPGSGTFKPLNFLVRSPWVTVAIIGKIKEPMLLVSGSLDEMVPASHMQRLREVAMKYNHQVVWVEFKNGTHMDTWMKGGDRYWAQLRHFVTRYAGPKMCDDDDGARNADAK
eukprot:TRINITY_DN6065_c0_g3_i4.p1 TRINITY_DN6065_c0_g3~~TRINITY_DN6065_c0_g3_i4.p1  ORF type:complete len:319 (+),score=59.42 TRINITY_DN6065_c0_g3_i4:209-1165(+)